MSHMSHEGTEPDEQNSQGAPSGALVAAALVCSNCGAILAVGPRRLGLAFAAYALGRRTTAPVLAEVAVHLESCGADAGMQVQAHP